MAALLSFPDFLSTNPKRSRITVTTSLFSASSPLKRKEKKKKERGEY